jgi:hypothetical protein
MNHNYNSIEIELKVMSLFRVCKNNLFHNILYMDSKESKYFAFYENGDNVEKDNIVSIVNLKGYKFIIKREKFSEYFYRWTCINEYEIESTIRDRNFECIDFSYRKYESGFSYINCKIRDLNRQSIHDLRIDPFDIDSIKEVLLPALDKMNELGSWRNFEISRLNKELQNQNEKLIKENDSLKIKNINLTQRISELESNIK